jgi:hypothetical protein
MYPSPRAITYWAPTNGESDFQEPRLVGASWDGDPLRIDEVALADDVQEGGFLFFGVSRDLNPHRVDGVRRIHSFAKIPNLRNLATIRVAVLC